MILSLSYVVAEWMSVAYFCLFLCVSKRKAERGGEGRGGS